MRHDRYTAKDVRAALEHETCTIEDFKALISPAAEPFLEQMAQRAKRETSKHFGNTVYLVYTACILQTIVKITACTVDLTAITTLIV